ncbi:DUF11 domain-containing protein [Termitidicoccus mucosus]|uniref:DUF11 domain-containing protein n=1 Tax=Termitidicoccus mucosus TaxID=1184151 RepID=A0A178IMN5_9BACT|nr:hypothetical protein AW736_05475 [Opitutaceae bacterium TSB47]
MNMTNTTPSSSATARRRSCLRVAFALLVLASFALFAHAAAPLVNTAIGNQASATYKDDSGVERTVLSNTVTTLVQQVYDLDLKQDNARTSNPGGQVFFPHTVTNLGNGIDTFTLGAVDGGGATTLGSIAIYIDADGDGNPDNFTSIGTTGPLAAGASFRFIVAATVPPGATVGSAGTVTVTATSTNGGDTPIVETNTDTVTLTNDAVLQVTKAATRGSGLPGTPVKYTITYRNIGNSAATNLKITDIIQPGLTYVDGSARWSVNPTQTLTDASADTEAVSGIDYNFVGTTATFVIASVAPGVSGYVTVEVTVDAGQAPGTITNTADYEFETGSGPTTVPLTSTNTVPFEVLPEVSLTFEGPATPLEPVPASGSVSFNNVLTNNGTGTDTFNIVVDTAGLGTAGKFPAGTTFQLFKSDRATPLTDTNGDGIPDTGPVAANGTYTVVLRANIPGNAAATDTTLSVTKTATSTVNPIQSAPATDTIAGITGAGVDLLGQSPATDGLGDSGTTIVNTETGNPGSTVTFTLNVKNTGPNPDTFDLIAWTNGTDAGTPTFGSSLPPGWTVVFKDGANNGVVSNTGIILADSTRTYTAEVTIPVGTSPGDISVWFRSQSPSTGAADNLRDRVTVDTVRGITIQTNNAGQIFPGGSVIYQHILTNTGNVTEGLLGAPNTLAIALANSLDGSAFTSVVYYDVDNNGTIDAGDKIVDTAAGGLLSSVKSDGLPKGESIRLLVKVQAPIGAADGAVNITTITATPAPGVDVGSAGAPAAVSNADATSVIRGNLTIVKEQSVDGGGTWTQEQRSAMPGGQIRYRITVTNVGSADAENIAVNDTVPVHTAYDSSFSATITKGSGSPESFTPPSSSGAGTALLFNIGTLSPTQTAVITFAVKIDE